MFLTAIFATFIHSIILLALLVLIYNRHITNIIREDSIISWISIILVTNTLIEAVGAGILTTVIARPLLYFKNSRSVKTNEVEVVDNNVAISEPTETIIQEEKNKDDIDSKIV